MLITTALNFKLLCKKKGKSISILCISPLQLWAKICFPAGSRQEAKDHQLH